MTMPLAWWLVALCVMLAELWRSRRNERVLRARGGYEPGGDVYRIMSWAYPATFTAMAMEGILRGSPRPIVVAAGLAVFTLAKALKFWAIAALGDRWTFRVLIVDEPLVTIGPYTWLRHPNYAAVLGEVLGFALLSGAPIAGTLSVLGFGELLRRRIATEERALNGISVRPATGASRPDDHARPVS
jgi:methyltransferase